ncbi:MAG: alpha/beta hydrolase [Pseudomonadales bacterium]|nr:alpha/beta hydrolase [Pseudomonadales bacterium]
MTSLTARVLKTVLKSQMKKELPSADAFVTHLRRIMNFPLSFPLTSGVTMRPDTVAGVPGEWLEVENPVMTIVFYHGGAFIGGRLATYHSFCGQWAKRLNARIFLADYRLAPEHPYPAAVNDCYEVYKDIQQNFSHQPLVMAGDSAGGNLTLVTLLRAKEDGIAMPNCALTLSPGSDLTDDVYSRQANAESDAMFDSSVFSLLIGIYCPDEDRTNPYISPAFGDFSGFPPLCVSVSDEEALRDDALKVVRNAKIANVPVQLISRDDMPHDWPILYPMLPEARQDMPLFIEFIKEHTVSALLNKNVAMRLKKSGKGVSLDELTTV